MNIGDYTITLLNNFSCPLCEVMKKECLAISKIDINTKKRIKMSTKHICIDCLMNKVVEF